MKDFAVFWGCTIPARFPFIEKATRLMFDDLGANVH
jgi:heterodisulfide reductase subunit B